MKLRMKCKNCGHWNRIEVNKLFIEQPTSEPKVKAHIPIAKKGDWFGDKIIPYYCKKCGFIELYKEIPF
jgi:hypothetical protein